MVQLLPGGSININTAGGGVLSAGIGRNNVFATGLTIGNFGLAMDGNSIGNCNNISLNKIVGNSSTNITIDANPTVTGTLSCNRKITGYGFNNFADNIDLWIEVGDTSSTGGGWKQIKIRGGLIYEVN